MYANVKKTVTSERRKHHRLFIDCAPCEGRQIIRITCGIMILCCFWIISIFVLLALKITLFAVQFIRYFYGPLPGETRD